MSAASPGKRKRGRHGCLNCRRKRKKCDEIHPTCTKCQRHGEMCEWDTAIIFRHNGLTVDHPSMTPSGPTVQQPPQRFTIIDVTSSVVRSCRDEEPSPDEFPGPAHATPRGSETRGGWSWRQLEESTVSTAASTRPFSSASPEHPRPSSGVQSPAQTNSARPRSHALSVPLPDQQARISSYGSPRADDPATPDIHMHRHMRGNGAFIDGDNRQAQRPDGLPRSSHSSSAYSTMRESLPTPTSVPSGDTHRHVLEQPSGLSLSAGELAALDFLTSQPQQQSPLDVTAGEHDQPWLSPDTNQEVASAFSNDHVMVESPDVHGLYYPTSAYKDLQQNLHSHIVETARNSGMTRQGSPVLSADGAPLHHEGMARRDADTVTGAAARLESLARTKTLTEQREIDLWQNYFDEVAPWLDKFDNQRHFQFTIPIMAKSCAHLRYSALALSARQQERKDPSRPYTESLGLYQEAIQNLVPELETMSTAVIASSVLLCVLEMIIVSPKDWGRHLDGCAILLQAANITGVSGGVDQALFWCFARMDVWGAYLSDSCTKVPLDGWLSSNIPMSATVNLFKNECKGFDAYANYAVFLSASVVNVINGRGNTFGDLDARSDFVARWKALFDLVEDWYDSRPVEMQPLLSYPASLDDYNYPFPKMLYGNPPAVNGNQLYHFCAIRLLQEKPKEARLSRRSCKSLIWHARQICGIAASNSHHGAWINGLQPLWVAGKLMSHPSEHRAILGILARIENESGWATKWRADELKEHWGVEH